ncbi:uncharacterized protein G2W53_027136 [Senna tora]|uniref:Uncharacterized protein n=1 Tax=Senna tora TaxID=362788 RepID=A0A834TIS0_9FABA|nr:uncharacterized protein G2W53_027136 [Senna tora]
MIPWFGAPAFGRAVIMGTEGLASRLLVLVAGISCHLMETARPFGEALERVIILEDSRERSHQIMPIQKAIQSTGDIVCGVNDSMVWKPTFGRVVIMGTEGLASRLLVVVAGISCHLMETARPFSICCPFKG